MNEDDSRRLAKRREAIAHVKRTLEYIENIEALINDNCFEDDGLRTRPRTPDPEDLSISKRRYEAAIQTWRADLRALTPPTRYTDVCYAFRRLGIPVQFTRNGPFWLFADGTDMLLPFDLTIIHHDDKVLKLG